MGVAIVAIPEDDDKVWKISSEKVPHLTLLFLGDQVDPDKLINIVEFVKHAASLLGPFWMTRDYRGALGPDSADVLFFEKDDWSFPKIAAFRAQLLQNDLIREAYNGAEQFPEWTPHLTLGYQKTPAHDDAVGDSHVYSVYFDRIAVWVSDFDGPEFRLKNEVSNVELAMSNIELGEEAADYLFHYGVPGMRWGVRKGDHPEVSRATNKDAHKDAKEFARAKMFYGEGAGTRRKLIKAKVEAKARKNADYKKAFDHHLAKQDLGKHADKARTERRRKNVTKSTTKTVKGAHRSLTGGFGQVSLASAVLAGGVVLAKKEMDKQKVSHGEEAVGELFHYGVKGMRWGVTTVDKASRPTLTREKPTKVFSTKDVTVTQRRAGTYAKARGGQRHKATDDAVKAVAARQKAKKSTTDALTNDELKAANERMRLEQEYHKLNSKTKRRGESFVAKLFQSKEARAVGADLAKRALAVAATA